ncbi:hypothetical protein ACHWQZ_G014547 [Mnemiopsis leidyi]
MAEIAFSSFYKFNNTRHDLLNIPKEEFRALKELSKNSEIVILKPDKGSGIVILNRSDYIDKMMDIIGDTTKFKLAANQDVYAISRTIETRVRNYLRVHVKNPGLISEDQYTELYPNGSHIGVMYGLPKVHKRGNPMRPICSAVGTATYQLGKFVAKIIQPTAVSSHGTDLNDTFQFVSQLRDLDFQESIMASFDVQSLFTNVPLAETIDVCMDKLYRDRYKANLVCCLVYRVYMIASSFHVLDCDLKQLCLKFYKNGFPKDFVEECISRVLNSSRNVAYYGVYPYVYSGGCHEPIPFSENPYLEEVLENMRIHFPNLQFNSAMVTKYLNGQQGIPSHSDDEDCISAGSMLCTISLGETRTLEFRSKCKTSLVNSKVRLAHGDVLFMTRGSQNQFQHSVPKDYTKNMRVSITLRHITCNINPVVSLTNVRFHECEIQASSVLSVGSTSKSNNTIINPSKDDQFPELGVKRTSIGVQTAPSDTSSVSILTDISSNTVYPVEKLINNDCHAPNSEESRSTSIYISSKAPKK